MIDHEKIQVVSDKIEEVAQTIEAVLKDEIHPGIELLGKARCQLEDGQTDTACEMLKAAAEKFDLSFDDESSTLHKLAEDAESCSFDFVQDEFPGFRVGE